MATPNYDIDYDRQEFQNVTDEKNAAIDESNSMYDGMIEDSDSYFQSQIDAVEKYGEEQKKNQQAQTDFAIEKIEQQKGQAEQDYIKEQSGAYKDWQKQSDAYGVNAEKMAAQGMQNTGYSESSQVAMYTSYQNRVATAREVYSRAVLNYDNAIKDAMLQNNSALAEIAYNTLKESLTLSLQGFQYKNQLLIEKTNKKSELDQIYHQRWQDVLDQINKENSLAETVRQFNESMAFEREQFNWQKEQAAKASSGSTIKKSSSNSSSKSAGSAVKVPDKPKLEDKYQKNSRANFSERVSAYNYLNQLIASGASEDKVANEISIALRDGAINKNQAKELRNKFTPRGVRYN